MTALEIRAQTVALTPDGIAIGTVTSYRHDGSIVLQPAAGGDPVTVEPGRWLDYTDAHDGERAAAFVARMFGFLAGSTRRAA